MEEKLAAVKLVSANKEEEEDEESRCQSERDGCACQKVREIINKGSNSDCNSTINVHNSNITK